MKIVYMGTPDFAVAPLKKIAEAGYDIEAVFTQPDRQKGRGKKVAYSDVKTAAIELGLEDKIYQPPVPFLSPECLGVARNRLKAE